LLQVTYFGLIILIRCNNLAAILSLDKYLNYDFKKFNASPEDYKEPPKKKALPEYFL